MGFILFEGQLGMLFGGQKGIDLGILELEVNVLVYVVVVFSIYGFFFCFLVVG